MKITHIPKNCRLLKEDPNETDPIKMIRALFETLSIACVVIGVESRTIKEDMCCNAKNTPVNKHSTFILLMTRLGLYLFVSEAVNKIAVPIALLTRKSSKKSSKLLGLDL